MLDEKIVLVTGASRGIGKAFACLAKNEGFNIILHGKKNKKTFIIIK